MPDSAESAQERETDRLDAVAHARALGEAITRHRAAYGALSRERAAAVRVLAEEFGMTQREIGEQIGKSGPWVWQIIHGSRSRRGLR